jgi:beta-lactamase class C
VAFDAFSEITQKVDGQNYGEAVKERILDPLGMTSASLTRKELKASGNYARPFGYSRGLGMVKPVGLNDNYYRVPAAGGMNSSIRDLAKYMKAQMGLAPDVISEEVLDQVHAPQIATWRERNRMRRRSEHVKHADYAMGWRTYDYAGHKLVGHRGAVRGYRAMILFDPKTDTGIAAMWNSETNKPVNLQYEVMDMALGLGQNKRMHLAADNDDKMSRGGN